MKRTFKYLVFLLTLGLLAISSKIQGQDITLTGDWYLTIGESDLQAGAGSDLTPSYTSVYNQISIDITNINTSWVVSVRGVATHWHPNLRFGVRRRTNGIGGGSISGGTSWLEVTGTDQQFFTGSLQRFDIGVQCGLTGVSIQIPPDTYSGTVIYTITQN